MATLTSALAGRELRVHEEGVQTVFINYNAAAVALEASAQTILMAKIPNNYTIVGLFADHSTGATSAPTDYGLSDGAGGLDLSVFASQATQGVGVTMKNLPYTVTGADSFVYVTVTPTLASSTTSYKCNLTVLYYRGTI